MWYNRAKLLESQVTDQWWRNNYLAHGHSYVQEDLKSKKNKDENRPPPNPNDAVWIFRNGSLEVITAGEWQAKGNRGVTFTHDDIFKEDTGGTWNEKTVTGKYIKGRYDARMNLVTVIVPIDLEKMYNVALKRIYQRFPGAKIQEFRSK